MNPIPNDQSARPELEAYCQKIQAALVAAEAFIAKYGHRLPKRLGELSAMPSLYSQTAKLAFTVLIGGQGSGDRDRRLSVLGEVFGRDNWTRKLNYSRTAYDWKKEIAEGWEVEVANAEGLHDPLDQTPVPPSAFPLLLEDAAIPSAD